MLQKKYEDYLEELYKLYPDIQEDSIKNIIEFGLKKLYSYVREGNDIFLRYKKDYMFIGHTSQESSSQWKASKLREHNKIRRLFLDKKEVWDGHHYIGLTVEENEEFQEVPIKVTLYKLCKECSIRKQIKYVYKIDLKYTIPANEIPWREDRAVSIEECELVENKALN